MHELGILLFCVCCMVLHVVIYLRLYHNYMKKIHDELQEIKGFLLSLNNTIGRTVAVPGLRERMDEMAEAERIKQQEIPIPLAAVDVIGENNDV